MRGRGFFSWLVCGLVCLGTLHARADEAADREEARKEFGAGQIADRNQNWKAAIDHYRRANDLVPHPNAVFNIATDYERLGRLREAGVWYQLYLDRSPDSPDRDKVARLLRDLVLRPGTLTVRSIPEGARVLVDNSFVGVTPYSGHIKGGDHHVIVEREGQREPREVKVEYGEPAILDVTLNGASGTLTVQGTPAGALVTVDQMPAGAMPVTLNLPPGTHTIRVTQYGYSPYDTTAAINANQETPVDVVLTKALGTFDGGKPKVPVGYLFGLGGGADLRGDGSLFMLEFGARLSQYDASVRIGKTVGLTAIDLLVRWALTKTKVAPFLCVGYSFIANTDNSSGSNSGGGGGYALLGGLRFDLIQNEGRGISLLAESGLRYLTGVTKLGPDGTTPVDGSELIVPFMASVQIIYR